MCECVCVCVCVCCYYSRIHLLLLVYVCFQAASHGGGGGKEEKGGCEDQRTDHLRIVVAQLHFSSVCSNTTCRDTCSPAASVFAFHCSAAQSLDHRTSMRCVPGHKMSAT